VSFGSAALLTQEGTQHKIQHIQVRACALLQGPNRHAAGPVLEALIDFGNLGDYKTRMVPAVTILAGWIAALYADNAKHTVRFEQHKPRGSNCAELVAALASELQCWLGYSSAFTRVHPTATPTTYEFVVACEVPSVTRAVLDFAIAMTSAALWNTPFDFHHESSALFALAQKHCRPDEVSKALVAAAIARHIPVMRVDADAPVLQLGYGIHQKRVVATDMGLNSSVAAQIVQTRSLTYSILRGIGLPVPDSAVVFSAPEAWAAAKRIGTPVRTSPNRLTGQNGGNAENRENAVNGGLCYEANVCAGFGLARVYGEDVIIERDYGGKAYRLLVVDGHMVAALLHSAETFTDVTDAVHPATARLAVLAAHALGLVVSGIDIHCADIAQPLEAQPLEAQNGVIAGVSAAPDLAQHLHPTQGKPRDARIVAAILDLLYPSTAPTQIPLLAVTGASGTTVIAHLLRTMYTLAHWTVGTASRDGVSIGEHGVRSDDASNVRGAHTVLRHPHTEAAVLEIAPESVLHEWLAFAECKIGIVARVRGEASEGTGLLDERAALFRVLIQTVDDAAVLNADDPHAVKLATSAAARVLFFSARPANPVILAHLAKGETCVTIEDQMIVIASREECIPVAKLTDIAFTQQDQGKALIAVENALAATAAAYAAGFAPEMIAHALTTFPLELPPYIAITSPMIASYSPYNEGL